MELAHLNALWRCNKCGACTAVCPLYQATVNEGMVARGKLALLEAVVDGALTPSQALRRKIEDCLLCGACAQSCPSMVPTTDLFLEARAELAALLGLPLPIRKLGLLHQVLTLPGGRRTGVRPASRPGPRRRSASASWRRRRRPGPSSDPCRCSHRRYDRVTCARHR